VKASLFQHDLDFGSIYLDLKAAPCRERFERRNRDLRSAEVLRDLASDSTVARWLLIRLSVWLSRGGAPLRVTPERLETI
jgi:hypothetical protein